MADFEVEWRISWLRVVLSLYWRRSRLLWGKTRNLGSIIIMFMLVMVERVAMNMKEEFITYRLLISLSVLVVEETLQTLNSSKLVLRLAGVGVLQYHLANLLAHFSLFCILYLLLYVGLEAFNSLYFHFILHPIRLTMTALLGILANVSFAHFCTLLLLRLTREPNVVLIIFILGISYVLFYLFSLWWPVALLFPPMLSCFALNQFIRPEDPNYSLVIEYPALAQDAVIFSVLPVQALFYFFLAVGLDFAFSRNCASPIQNPSAVPLRARLHDLSMNLDLSFTVESGQVCGVVGPPESGKTSLVALLTQLARKRRRYSGECQVLGANVLKGYQLGGSALGVVL